MDTHSAMGREVPVNTLDRPVLEFITEPVSVNDTAASSYISHLVRNGVERTSEQDITAAKCATIGMIVTRTFLEELFPACRGRI
jgi:hypothetical protein